MLDSLESDAYITGGNDSTGHSSPLREHLMPPSASTRIDPNDGAPPYKPEVNDHTSLNMLEDIGGRNYEFSSSVPLSRPPRVYRSRSTTSDRSDASAPVGQFSEDDDNLYTDPPRLTRCKSTPAHSLRASKRDNSEALKFNSPAFSDSDILEEAFSEYGFTSKSFEGENDNSRVPATCVQADNEQDASNEGTERLDAITAPFEGFDSSVHEEDVGEETQELQIPLSIRLRRASEQYQNQVAQRKKSLSLLKSGGTNTSSAATSTNVQSESSRLPLVSRKSSVVSAAVTHTNVNPFIAEVDSAQNATKEPQMKPNATLQIVQSRDSVYEVIWEDSLVHGVVQAESVKTSRSNDAPQSHNQGRLKRANTKLAAWTWGHLPSSPFNTESQGEVLFEPSNTLQFLSGTSHELFDTEERADTIQPDDPPKPSPPPKPSSPPHLSLTIPNEEAEVEPLPKRRSSTSEGRLSPQQRRQLLGNRKLSNLSPEEEHFNTHRDSLVLAHHRIFREDVALPTRLHPRPDEVMDPHIQHLPQDTWARPKQGASSSEHEAEHVDSVALASAPGHRSLDATVGSLDAPSLDRKASKGKGKKRIYVLGKESEHDEDSYGDSQCLH